MSGISRRTQIIVALSWLLVGIVATISWLVDRPGINIAWQTETEFDSAGFNLLRSESEAGPYAKLNDRLISASDDAAAGADYTFVDSQVVPGQLYHYQLEDVDLAGNATRHETITYEAPGRPVWLLASGITSLVVGAALMITVRSQDRQRVSL